MLSAIWPLKEKYQGKKLNFLGLMTSCNFFYKEHSTTKRNASLMLKTGNQTPTLGRFFWYFNERISRRKRKVSKRGKMNKERVAAKFKSIRCGFKKAIDCGKESCGGRVVFTFLIILTIFGVVAQLLLVYKIVSTFGSHYQMTTRIRFHPFFIALYLLLQMLKI